jgi:hypothetical protein
MSTLWDSRSVERRHVNFAFGMRAFRRLHSVTNDAYDAIQRLRRQLHAAQETVRRQAQIDMLTISLRRIRQGEESVSEYDSSTKDEEMWDLPSPRRHTTPEFVDSFNSPARPNYTDNYSQSHDEDSN